MWAERTERVFEVRGWEVKVVDTTFMGTSWCSVSTYCGNFDETLHKYSSCHWKNWHWQCVVGQSSKPRSRSRSFSTAAGFISVWLCIQMCECCVAVDRRRLRWLVTWQDRLWTVSIEPADNDVIEPRYCPLPPPVTVHRARKMWAADVQQLPMIKHCWLLRFNAVPSVRVLCDAESAACNALGRICLSVLFVLELLKALTQKLHFWCNNYNNKSAQSNLARRPRRGALAHVRPVGPCGQLRATNSPPKVPLRVDRSPNPTTCLIPATMPNGVRIRSAVFPQCTGQTDRPTDRSFTGKFDDYRPLRSESDAA